MAEESTMETIERLRAEMADRPCWDQPGADPLGDIRRYVELSRLVWLPLDTFAVKARS